VNDNCAIRAVSLTRVYGDLVAVDHVDFEVHRGEIFGFLGPNGSGKTTTVRMLTTLLEPTEGTALINGYDVCRQRYQVKQQFGFVPEESNVYTALSTWDNLMYTARLYCVPQGERERRACELLALFALEDKRDVKVQFLSKGMRRRLTVAMALIHRPPVLFLDEPLIGLDVHCAQLIKAQIRQLNAEGTTIFVTTHQIEVANQLCDRVAIIDLGRIAAVDRPERLKRAFQSVQSVEVALDGQETEQHEGLKALPGVTEVLKQGDKVRLYTADPSAVIEEVVGYARSQGLHVLSLNTLGPSLEDAFLAITGQPMAAAQVRFHREACRECPMRDTCDKG
jgi:ABC-2 type transport system ATP-binding protein